MNRKDLERALGGPFKVKLNDGSICHVSDIDLVSGCVEYGDGWRGCDEIAEVIRTEAPGAAAGGEFERVVKAIALLENSVVVLGDFDDDEREALDVLIEAAQAAPKMVRPVFVPESDHSPICKLKNGDSVKTPAHYECPICRRWVSRSDKSCTRAHLFDWSEPITHESLV